MPHPGAVSDGAVWRLSVWRLKSVRRLSRTSGRRAACAAGRLDGTIGWSGQARPVWLKAAAARFRCRPGRGHIVAAARLQLVTVNNVLTTLCQWILRMFSGSNAGMETSASLVSGIVNNASKITTCCLRPRSPRSCGGGAQASKGPQACGDNFF